jgi:isoleucyl-tRNA synthetase
MGISANPNERYSVMRVDKAEGKNLAQGELLLIAKPLTADDAPLKKNMNILAWSEIKEIEAENLDRLTARHPFYEKDSLFMLGDHVLMTDGTGLVHTAPAHGLEDYEIGLRYALEPFNPVDDHGRFKSELPIFGGKDINEATPEILQLLEDNGSLIAKSKLSHSYPHCWRCKKPVIYRTTPQWFISMEHNDLRKKALSAITNDVRWTPEWGSNRIYSMVENRPDWCISRQRLWGVPIALFTCKKCGKVITDDAVQAKVIASFKERGADAWYENDISYYLGNDTKCPACGGDIQKEMDILDVWFDSGTSHAAVCEVREELGGTADMYLEGTDQHRGWFHSSLLESIATRGKAPYKEVLTHGFVVDDDLQKMSKSLGNAVTPDEILKTYGAEILRLWVAAEDYTNDIRISPLILTRLVESYRKIRNTCRFLLGNLYDFEPADALEFKELKQLDRYILLKWQDCLERLYNGFENYQFHIFFHSIMNFCTNDLSSFYLDIIKDRLYSSIPDSGDRRSAQTAIFILTKELAAVIAPILSFTADEVWEFIPAWDGKPESVFTEYFPKLGRFEDDALRLRFDRLLSVRKVANRALEKARADKIIGHSLDAALVIGVKDGRDELSNLDEELSRLLIVSEAEIRDYDEGAAEKDDSTSVSALPSDAPKCERCWSRSKQTDENGLCPRCVEVLKGMRR